MSDSPGAATENSARALKVISAAPSPTLPNACGSDTPAHTAPDECAATHASEISPQRLTPPNSHDDSPASKRSDHTRWILPGSVESWLEVSVGSWGRASCWES